MAPKAKNLLRKSHGRLTPVELIRVHRRRAYRCNCTCGAIVVVAASNLISGATQSCGCLLNEYLRKTSNGFPTGMNRIVRSYMFNAKQRSLPWLLNDDEIFELLTSECYYCGVRPQQVRKGRVSEFRYNGLDRVVNSGGYTKENTVSCCWLCNRAKMNMTPKEFADWATRFAVKTLAKVRFL